MTIPLGYLATQNIESNSTIAVEEDLNVAILEEPTANLEESIVIGPSIPVHATAVTGVACVRFVTDKFPYKV